MSQPDAATSRAVCTFVWRGHASDVAVQHAIRGFPQPLRMRRARGADLWRASIDVPRGSRIEYRLLIRHGGHVENVLDPENPRIATGPAGEMSVLLADGYETPVWAERIDSVPRGELVDVQIPSAALTADAHVTVYVPADAHARESLPLLVMHDGTDYLRHSAFATVLDNLMHRNLVARCVVALTDPVDRLRHYAADPAHTQFVLDELVPALAARFALRGDPGGLVLGGASFGAVASLAVAVDAPGRIGGLLLQSASLRDSVPDGAHPAAGAFAPVLRFVGELRARPHRVTPRIFQSFGAFEPLADPNRAIAPVLRGLADEVLSVEGLDGHNWTAWRDRLADGLTWLLPGEEPADAVTGAAVGERATNA